MAVPSQTPISCAVSSSAGVGVLIDKKVLNNDFDMRK